MPSPSYQWADLLWLPAALAMTHRGHRLLACGFVAACLLTLRLEAEIMEAANRPAGFTGLLGWSAAARGEIVFGLAIAVFLLLARMSRGAAAVVFLAAMLIVYLFAAVAAMLFMAV